MTTATEKQIKYITDLAHKDTLRFDARFPPEHMASVRRAVVERLEGGDYSAKAASAVINTMRGSCSIQAVIQALGMTGDDLRAACGVSK